MKKHNDAIGTRYGMLTLLEVHKPRTWVMQCDCGTEKTLDKYNVTSGRQVSCGCNRLQKSKALKRDITGMTFSRLTVLRRVRTSKRHTRYLCECVCGRRTAVQYSNLLNGSVRSCGCSRKDLIEEATYNKVHNRLRKKYGPAKNYQCCICHGQGHEWAFDHTDSAEPTNGSPFSVDASRYFVLCIACHRKFDKAKRKYGFKTFFPNRALVSWESAA